MTSFLAKLVLAAFFGLFLAAVLVVCPGYWCLNTPNKLRLEPKLQVDLMECRNGLTWDNTLKFRNQMFLLGIAQQEIDCLPILLSFACIGPIVLVFRRNRARLGAAPEHAILADENKESQALVNLGIDDVDTISAQEFKQDSVKERKSQE